MLKKILKKKSTYVFFVIAIFAIFVIAYITNAKHRTYEVSTVNQNDFIITSIDLGKIVDPTEDNTDVDQAYVLYEQSIDEIPRESGDIILQNRLDKESDDLYIFNSDESNFSVQRDALYNYKVYLEDTLIDEFELSFMVSDPVKNIISINSTQTSPSEYLYIEYEMNDLNTEDIDDMYYTSIKYYWDTYKSDFRLDKDILNKDSFGLYEVGDGIVFFETQGNGSYLYNYGIEKIELDDKKIMNTLCCMYSNMNIKQYEDKVVYYSIKSNNHFYKNTIEFPKDYEGKGKRINPPNRVQEILETFIDREEVWNKEGDIYEFGVGWVGGVYIIEENDPIFDEVNFREEYTLKNGWIIKTWEDKEYKSYTGNHLITVRTSDEIIKIGLNKNNKDKLLCLIKSELVSEELIEMCQYIFLK